MKSNTRLYISLFIACCIIAMAGYGIYWAFFDIQRIQGQELLSSVASPNETYTISLYRNNGGTTTDYAILGVLTDNRTQSSRNIYWQYHHSEAKVVWLNDEVVVINGIELSVRGDVYDYRRE